MGYFDVVCHNYLEGYLLLGISMVGDCNLAGSVAVCQVDR